MTYMTNTAAIATAHADYIAQTIEANAAYCKPVSIDYAWSTCETLVDGEWHPIPLVSITWDNGNTVRLDNPTCTTDAVRLNREGVTA